MGQTKLAALLVLIILSLSASSNAGTLAWPIGCIPGIDCLGERFLIGYPDIDGDGRAFDCGAPAYTGHNGTDIYIGAVEDGVPVLASADGEVIVAADGRYDRCPNPAEPDCLPPAQNPLYSGTVSGQEACRELAPGCTDCSCLWGFDAGNYLLIRHRDDPEVSLTLYAHLRKGSVFKAVGQAVRQGEPLAEVASSGNAATPHLHFGVWKKGGDAVVPADPWVGPCSSQRGVSLWQYDPPYRADLAVVKTGRGAGSVVSSQQEIQCGSRCRAGFIPGTVVTLTATPEPGSRFTGWEGGCFGTAGSCTVSVTGATEVRAGFSDAAPPTVHAFSVLPIAGSLSLPVLSFSADDNVRVSGYLISESPDRPPLNAPGWRPTPAGDYTCSSPGVKKLYAWARDPSGNISPAAQASVTCASSVSLSAAVSGGKSP